MNMPLQAPIDLEILLWFHTRADAYTYPGTEPYNEAVERLLKAGVIAINQGLGTSPYFTTPLGEAFVDLIMSTPVPVVEYKDPRFMPKKPTWKEVLGQP